MRRVLILACLLALVAGCRSGSKSSSPRDHAVQLIRDCQVREVEMLHSGVIYVRPKSGRQVELHGVDGRKILREMNRAERRCGGVRLLME